MWAFQRWEGQEPIIILSQLHYSGRRAASVTETNRPTACFDRRSAAPATALRQKTASSLGGIWHIHTNLPRARGFGDDAGKKCRQVFPSVNHVSAPMQGIRQFAAFVVLSHQRICIKYIAQAQCSQSVPTGRN